MKQAFRPWQLALAARLSALTASTDGLGRTKDPFLLLVALLAEGLWVERENLKGMSMEEHRWKALCRWNEACRTLGSRRTWQYGVALQAELVCRRKGPVLPSASPGSDFISPCQPHVFTGEDSLACTVISSHVYKLLSVPQLGEVFQCIARKRLCVGVSGGEEGRSFRYLINKSYCVGNRNVSLQNE